MSQTEVDYLNRRAQQHRDRSAACADPTSRRLHDQFAARYAARATELTESLVA